MLELCRVTTEDGLQLDGLLRQPESDDACRRTALILIHGTGGNFYGSGVLARIADDAVQSGYPVLRINTRGHDLAAFLPGPHGPVRGGAAFEHVAEAPLDIAAWADGLSQRGFRRVVLVGHSLGGVKALRSQSTAPHPAVTGVIGLNPPRFSHQKFQADPRCAAFRRDYAEAECLVADGQPERLINITQPLPMIITAAGYLEKYGPGDPLDYVPLLPKITCPHLIVLGGQCVEANPAFDGLSESLNAARHSSLTCELVPGADINFRNDPSEPWRRMNPWLARAERADTGWR